MLSRKFDETPAVHGHTPASHAAPPVSDTPPMSAETGMTSPQSVLRMQQQVGNQSVRRMIQSKPGAVQRYLAEMDKPATIFNDVNFTDQSMKSSIATLMDLYMKRTLYPGGYDYARKKYSPTRKTTWQFVDFLEANTQQYGAGIVNPIVAAYAQYEQGREGGNLQAAYQGLLTLATRLDTAMDGGLKNFFLKEATESEKTDKKRYINLILDYLHPQSAAFAEIAAQEHIELPAQPDLKDYVEAITSIITSPKNDYRLLQSIKGTNSPYSSKQEDDDIEANRSLIQTLANEKYKGAKFRNYTPNTAVGEHMNWDRWRKDDCVYAGILYAMTQVKRTERNNEGVENVERPLEEGIAGDLGIETGIVEDSILVLLMRRLGWAYRSGWSWNLFKQKANQSKLYVISYDVVSSGTKGHTVVAYYTGGNWKIYDRQGYRLNGTGETEPTYGDNPLNAWEVNTESASVILSSLH